MAVYLKPVGLNFNITGVAETECFTSVEMRYLVEGEIFIQDMPYGCPVAIKIAVAAVYETSGINQEFAGPALAGIPDGAA